MDLRKTMNRHPGAAAAAVIAVVAIAIAVAVVQTRGSGPLTQSFYTTDGGKTWFTDARSKVPPFDHGGKPAVRCYVFAGKAGKFAGLLEQTGPGGSLMVKRPADADWAATDAAQESMLLVHTTNPDGSDADQVLP